MSLLGDLLDGGSNGGDRQDAEDASSKSAQSEAKVKTRLRVESATTSGAALATTAAAADSQNSTAATSGRQAAVTASSLQRSDSTVTSPASSLATRPTALGGTVQLTQETVSPAETTSISSNVTSAAGAANTSMPISASGPSNISSLALNPASSPSAILSTDSGSVSTFPASITLAPSTSTRLLPASSDTLSTSALNRMAASQDAQQASTNIFVPGAKLFPLGITVIVVGGLFFLIALGMVLVRAFGWNKKRRIRQAIPSFIDVDPENGPGRGRNEMFEPNFATITTNYADVGGVGNRSSGGNPFSPAAQGVAGTRPTQPEYSSTASAEGGYAGVGANLITRDYRFETNQNVYDGVYFTDQPAVSQQQQQTALNPFMNPPNAYSYSQRTHARGTERLDVPTDVDMGSPVPSFLTGQTPYMQTQTGAQYFQPQQPQGPSREVSEAAASAGGIGVAIGRSLTRSSHSSTSSGSSGEVLLGSNPSQSDRSLNYRMAHSTTNRQQIPRGSGDIVSRGQVSRRGSKGSDGAWSEGSVWSSDDSVRGLARLPSSSGSKGSSGSRKLGKGAVWESDRV